MITVAITETMPRCIGNKHNECTGLFENTITGALVKCMCKCHSHKDGNNIVIGKGQKGGE